MTEPTKHTAGIREHHGRFQVRYYGTDGKERAKSFPNISEARKFRAAVATDKDRGEWRDPRDAEIRFGVWARQHLDSRSDLRASTRATDESYARNHVLPHFEHAPLGRIGPLNVQAWLHELSGSGLAPKTVRECYRLLDSIMAAAVDARLISQSPCQGIKKPRVPRREQRFLTSEEVEKLVEALDPHYRALLYSAVYLGARWGELVGLKRESLDLLRRRVYIVGSLEEVGGRVRWMPETKTGASRRALSMPGFLVDEIAAHLASTPAGDFVFTSKRGHLLHRGTFRLKVWLPAVERAGFSPLRFHDLRHTCASLLIAGGAHPKEIQARLGHSSITTTLNVYGHLFPSLDDRLAERLDATYREAKADQERTNGDSRVIELPGASD